MSPLLLASYILLGTVALGLGLFVCFLLWLQAMVLYYAVVSQLSDNDPTWGR